LRAVTPEELAWLVELSRGSVIHIHIAEQTKEVDDCIAWSGRRPVEWLLEHTAVDERWSGLKFVIRVKDRPALSRTP
jgi:cytosine/adenosine deaminase-related metal-dependent hydrolase